MDRGAGEEAGKGWEEVRRRRQPFKACIKCKLLVPFNVEECPNCGSTEFSDDWEGMVIIIDPEKSLMAQKLELKKPGRYAVKLRR